MSRTISRLAKGIAGVLAGVAVVLLQASPAAALPNVGNNIFAGSDWPGYIRGSAVTDGDFNMQLVSKAGIYFGPTSTMATGCNMTLWLDLYNDSGGKWRTQKVTHSCTSALRKGQFYYYWGDSTGTTATWVQTMYCVDMYWNNSPYSGQQYCGNSSLAHRT